MDWEDLIDLSNQRSAQASSQPRCFCGRFAKFVRYSGDQFGNSWALVQCVEHGVGKEKEF